MRAYEVKPQPPGKRPRGKVLKGQRSKQKLRTTGVKTSPGISSVKKDVE